MKQSQSVPAAGPEILDLNLLPASQRPAEISPAMALIVAGILVAILAIAPLALRMSHEEDRANAVAEQADAAEQQLHGLQVELAARSGLQRELASTTAQLDALRSKQAQLQGGQRTLVDDLSQMFRPDHLPAGARLKTVAGTNTGLRVEGTAPGPLEALAYANLLAKDAGFASATLISFAPAGSGGQFVVEVTR